MPSCCSLNPVLVCSRAVTQVLTWTTLMGVIYTAASLAWPHTLRDTSQYWGSLWTTVIVHSVLNLMLILHPLGGALGDVYWGRYKAVVCGKAFLTVSMAITSIGSIFLLCDYVNNTTKARTLVTVFIAISLILLFVGLAIFTSNIIQFGLDRLVDGPGGSLGVFVHWLVWSVKIGVISIEILYATSQCVTGKAISYVTYMVPLVFFLLLVFLHLLSSHTRNHFNIDRVKYNPYKLIYKVLNFARKNKYPVGPVSAFTRCYNFRPSRLDYAKERYGGPFTTSDVEDVKSFKNVFLILLALGPVLVLNVPTTIYFFNMFSLHLGVHVLHELNNGTCDHTLAGGYFSEISSILLFPIYIWLVYSVLRNKPITILQRLLVGVVLYILALASMLVVELTGHLMLYMDLNQAQPLCMFVDQEYDNQRLKMHWFAIVFPMILKSISYDMVLATTLEFISAQSPHTMKGVLVGSFATILGIFHSLGAILLVPFSLDSIWKDGYLGEHPPVISCGFGYYLVCITVALIGLGSLIVAVKRYKYRRRDEEPYSQACVEEIFARRLANRAVSYDRQGYQELSGSNINS